MSCPILPGQIESLAWTCSRRRVLRIRVPPIRPFRRSKRPPFLNTRLREQVHAKLSICLSQTCIEERGALTTTEWSNGRYPNSGRSRPSLIVIVLFAQAKWDTTSPLSKNEQKRILVEKWIALGKYGRNIIDDWVIEHSEGPVLGVWSVGGDH
jgi:hypothetical protein